MHKKKAKPFRAAKAVKSAARNTLGSPPPTRRIPLKTKKAGEKYKPSLGRWLQEDS